MQLASFLNKVFKKGGFILTDANSKDYIIGEPGNNPMKLKILKKDLNYKLLFHPDLYSASVSFLRTLALKLSKDGFLLNLENCSLLYVPQEASFFFLMFCRLT